MLQVMALEKVFVSCNVMVVEGKKLNAIAVSYWLLLDVQEISVLGFTHLGGGGNPKLDQS